jgi:hypothetical protein
MLAVAVAELSLLAINVMAVLVVGVTETIETVLAQELQGQQILGVEVVLAVMGAQV